MTTEKYLPSARNILQYQTRNLREASRIMTQYLAGGAKGEAAESPGYVQTPITEIWGNASYFFNLGSISG